MTALVALKRVLRKFAGDQSGAILVEMALLTPFMLILSAGVFEFSNLIHTRLLVEAGVTDAATYYTRCRHTPADAAACETAAKDIALTAANGSTRVKNWTAAQITLAESSVATTTIDADTGETNYRSNSGKVITVLVSTNMPYPDSGLLNFIGINSLSIVLSSQQRVMGW